MADFKKSIAGSIRAARHWLAHAEDSFGNNRDIRGELDLLLAQAELQRVREAKGSSHWYSRFSLFSQGVAVVLALFIAVAGLGGAYWLVHDGRSVIPSAIQDQTVMEKPALNVIPVPPSTRMEKQQNDIASAVPRETTAILPKAVIESSSVTAQSSITEQHQKSQSMVTQSVSEQERPADKEIVLPPDEMQKLIRAAGKSLRGQ